MFRNTSITARKLAVWILSLCVVFTVCAPVRALASGSGYSDVIRFYGLVGVENNADVYAAAVLYGDAQQTAGNYAAVVKFSEKKEAVSINIVSGDELSKLLNNSALSSQMDVKSVEQMLKASGESTDILREFSQKPVIVDELEKAFASGLSTVTVQDHWGIMPDALKLAADRGGSPFRIHFDSVKGNGVDVRMTVVPAQATKGIVAFAATYGSTVDRVVERFQRLYSNEIAAIQFLQEGSFGTTVSVAAKLDLKNLQKDSLVFYTYDVFTDQYSKLENVQYSFDDSGYLCFSTTVGNVCLITDRELTLK